MQKRKDKINRKKYHSILVIAAIAIVVLLDAGHDPDAGSYIL